MATLSFEGDTEEELIARVRRWLRSTEQPSDHTSPTEAVERLADLVKDGMTVIASAAPQPVAHTDVARGLTKMGYRLTDDTTQALQSGLNALAELSGDRLVTRVRRAGQAMAYEMQSALAHEVMRAVGRH